MIDKVRKILGLGSRKTGNKLILSVEKLESRVALLENGRLEEYSVERKTSRNIVGSVYKGRVKNIEMGLKAMFVDIGFEKNAFLHFWDAIPAALDSGIEEIDRPANRRPRKRITAKDIPNIYPVGSDVIVQVTKGPIGTKGPRVTTNLSFPGRYLVLMPFSDHSGISRKIENPKERERLRKILRELSVPEGTGVIIRTVGEGQKARYFIRDLAYLIEQWRHIEQQMKEKSAAACVFQEPDLVERTVRDFLTDEIARQLRLRNIGGLIIGDFIDMKSRKDQQQVYQRMKDRQKRDKAKTHVLPISPLGLMEMTRQRAQESISGSVYQPCPYCNGRGKVKTPMSMSVEIQRELHRVMKYYVDIHEVRVQLHPSVLERLRKEDEELL